MKALSVRAPWWWFILHGGKDIENRGRISPCSPKFRGPVWLHASRWYVHKEVVDDIWFAERTIPGIQIPTAPYEFLCETWTFLPASCISVISQSHKSFHPHPSRRSL